jgi:hypothetical protein
MGTVTVVRGEARRRWLVVATVGVALAALPAVVQAVPVHAPADDVARLAARVRASAAQPYEGYAESLGTAGLPALPQLTEVSDLLNGDTRLRVWYASANRWRVDVIDVGAERGTYQTPTGQVVWDYGRNQLTEITGNPPVRLPRGADLTPPDLARRLLAAAGDQVTLSALPPQRVAGIDAAGLRATPTSPLTTVGHIDMWADPVTALPLRVAVTGRAARDPVLVTRFLQVSRHAPDPAVLVPPAERSTMSVTATDPSDLLDTLNSMDTGALPDRLAGQDRADLDSFAALPVGAATSQRSSAGIGSYGAGLARFLVLPVPRRTGFTAMRRAARGGGTSLTFPNGEGVLISTPLLSVLAMDSHSTHQTYLLAGLVDPALLRQAGAELSLYPGSR